MSKTALITGYTSLLGQEIARVLVESGYIVYVGVRNDSDVTTFSSQIIPVPLDITSDASCATALGKIARQTKKLNVIVNVAGNTLQGAFETFTSADFIKLFDVNVVGAFRLAKAAVPLMSHQSASYIINITSLNSFMAAPNYALYSASKHALQAFDWAIGIELHKKNINVISLAPGALASPTSGSSMKHTPIRTALPIVGWLLPLTSPIRVADKVSQIIDGSVTGPLILVGRDAQIIYWLQKLLPSSLWFRVQNWLWSKQV